MEAFDGASKRVVVIPNTVCTAEALSAPERNWCREKYWPGDSIVVGYCGRLSRIKGADILLEALYLLKQHIDRVCLVIVGDGAQRKHLEALADQLGLKENTHFAGRVPREQIFSAIKGFDITVVPSREEGFGLSALESLAAGVPVIASRLDALAEVVVEGRTGLLCNPEDPVDLEKKLVLLIEDDTLRHRMAEAAAVHASAVYDRQVYEARLADMLLSLGFELEGVG